MIGDDGLSRRPLGQPYQQASQGVKCSGRSVWSGEYRFIWVHYAGILAGANRWVRPGFVDRAPKGRIMAKIKVAIIGVGNCASSLVQGIHKYVELPEDSDVPGVMHTKIGDYRIEDIQVVAAFDIDENKVGKDLSEAIFAKPNNTLKFANVPHLPGRASGAGHDPR